MMITDKLISGIIKIGSVVAVTLTSFVIMPPAITSDTESGVYWHNIITFAAGILSILLYDLFVKKIKAKALSFYLLGMLLLLFVTY